MSQMSILLNSNTIIDRRLRNLRHLSMASEVDYSDENSSSNGVLNSYHSYISEVIVIMIKHTQPQENLDIYTTEIMSSAKLVVQIGKYIYQLVNEAENMTKNSTDALSDLENVYASELQNITDTYISPKKALPIWERYLTLMFNGMEQNEAFDLKTDKILTSKSDIRYLEMITEFLTKISLAQIELYLWWTIVEELVLHTTTHLRELHNEYSQIVTDLETSTPRSLYCAGGVNQLMGMAVSYSIVNQDFISQTKPKVDSMLKNIRQAFSDLVMKTSWMDQKTKIATLDKAKTMKSFIGFPNWILVRTELERFYNGLEINETTHLANMLGILKWRMNLTIQTWREKSEFGWATAPTNVNAFHTFQANAISMAIY